MYTKQYYMLLSVTERLYKYVKISKRFILITLWEEERVE